jgi:hypothetical protein
MNKPAYIMRDNSITVFVDGKPNTVDSSHPNFVALRQAILDAEYDLIPSLISISSKIEDMSFGNIRVIDGNLFYKNHQLHGVVVDKLFELLKAGAKDVEALINFIERLMVNPSANSVNELYSFLSYKSLPITSDGKFLAYKGVDNNYYSKHGNKDTIVVKGKVSDSGSIYNGVGETIEVARRSVDDNKDNHCSFGLHVGSYDYANEWAGRNGRLLVVEVDPADAVSVPTDCSFQKLRVSKYTVISDITADRKEIPSAVYDYSDVDDSSDNDSEDWDSSDEYDVDCEDCDCDESDLDDFRRAVLAAESSRYDNEYHEFVKLKIKNYIENQHLNGNYPTVKQIQSRMKGHDLSVDQILDIATHDLNYIPSASYDSDGNEIPTGQLQILPPF